MNCRSSSSNIFLRLSLSDFGKEGSMASSECCINVRSFGDYVNHTALDDRPGFRSSLYHHIGIRPIYSTSLKLNFLFCQSKLMLFPWRARRVKCAQLAKINRTRNRWCSPCWPTLQRNSAINTAYSFALFCFFVFVFLFYGHCSLTACLPVWGAPIPRTGVPGSCAATWVLRAWVL